MKLDQTGPAGGGGGLIVNMQTSENNLELLVVEFKFQTLHQ